MPLDFRFGSKADIAESDWHVRFVPKADSCTAAINPSLRQVMPDLRQELARAVGLWFGNQQGIISALKLFWSCGPWLVSRAACCDRGYAGTHSGRMHAERGVN